MIYFSKLANDQRPLEEVINLRVGDYVYVPEPGSLRARLIVKLYPVLRGVAKVVCKVSLTVGFAAMFFSLIAERFSYSLGQDLLQVSLWLLMASGIAALLWLLGDLRIRSAISEGRIAPYHSILRTALSRAARAEGLDMGGIYTKETHAIIFRMFFHEKVRPAIGAVMRGEPREKSNDIEKFAEFKADDKLANIAYEEVIESSKRRRNSTSV